MRDLGSHLAHAEDIQIITYHLVPNVELTFISIYRGGIHICLRQADTFAVEAVSHVERIESRLGVDFEHASVSTEYLVGHTIVSDKSWLGQHCLVLRVEEVIAADGVAQVHIHYTPWREHCFFVGEAEASYHLCYCLYTFVDGQRVCCFRFCRNVGSGCSKAVFLEYAQLHERLHLGLAYALRHEHFPRSIVHLVENTLKRDILVL